MYGVDFEMAVMTVSVPRSLAGAEPVEETAADVAPEDPDAALVDEEDPVGCAALVVVEEIDEVVEFVPEPDGLELVELQPAVAAASAATATARTRRTGEMPVIGSPLLATGGPAHPMGNTRREKPAAGSCTQLPTTGCSICRVSGAVNSRPSRRFAAAIRFAGFAGWPTEYPAG